MKIYLRSPPASGHKADLESLELPPCMREFTDQRHEESLQSIPWPRDFKSLFFSFKTFFRKEEHENRKIEDISTGDS